LLSLFTARHHRCSLTPLNLCAINCFEESVYVTSEKPRRLKTNCAAFERSRSVWVYAFLVLQMAQCLDHFSVLHVLTLASFDLCHQLYADNVQAHSYCSPGCAVAAKHQICLASNDQAGCQARTGSFLTLQKLNSYGSAVEGNWWVSTMILWLKFSRRSPFSDSVRDHGIILDKELSFLSHINQLSRSWDHQLRQRRTVSGSLPHDAATTLPLPLIDLVIDAQSLWAVASIWYEILGGRGSGSKQISIFPGKLPKISIFSDNFTKSFDFPGKNWSFTATSGQIILFLFKSHHFWAY